MMGKSWARAFRSSIPRTSSFVAGSAPKEFQLYPYFFSPAEQRILLGAALQKLDSTGSRLFRKRSKAAYATRPLELPNVVDLFLSDDHYQFEEVRLSISLGESLGMSFDLVISPRVIMTVSFAISARCM
jgi:hypothetical protein